MRCATYQCGAVVVVGEVVLGVIVVLEQVEDKFEDLRRADPVRVPQVGHRPSSASRRRQIDLRIPLLKHKWMILSGDPVGFDTENDIT